MITQIQSFVLAKTCCEKNVLKKHHIYWFKKHDMWILGKLLLLEFSSRLKFTVSSKMHQN